MPNALAYLGLVDAGNAIRAGQVSSLELTRMLLERIERLDARLHSYARLAPELALRAAAEADAEIARGEWRGLLHGVPVAVKDLCDTAGIVTAAGMTIHCNNVPTVDSTVVARLKRAGAVLLGKLQMTEGAFSLHHPSIKAPVNPWNAELWPGVSSSGSGVATAAGLCYGSLGSDTLGSIRFPSAMNNVTGLKPTRGRVSRAGVFALAETLDHVGPMARSAIDCAAMLGAIAGADPEDPTAVQDQVPDYLAGIEDGISGLRIGIDPHQLLAGVDEDVADVVDQAARVFDGLGARLREIEFPSPDQAVRDAVQLCATEAAVAHEATYPARAADYGPGLSGLLSIGLEVSGATMARIEQRRAVFCGRVAALWRDIDLLLMPVMSLAAPTYRYLEERVHDPEARYSRIRFTAPFDLTGSPALTLPGGATALGMPLGFQLVGRHLDEARLLRAGHAFQQETAWHTRRPGID